MNKRIQSIDILRGITIFLMVMSANIAWSSGLPGWMFHCQVPPPDYVFNPDIKGITWVDLVFPFFIFSMGASMPFSLGGKLRKGVSKGKVSLGIIKRWLILAAFGLVLGNAGLISSYTDMPKVLLRFGIWIGMFLALWRVNRPKGWIINLVGALVVVALLLVERRAFGVTLSVKSNNIIIMILSLLALLGGFVWLISKDNWKIRALIFLAACILKELSWHSDCLNWADFPSGIKWLVSWGYAQYLVILIAGMSVGDVISRARERGECQFSGARRPSSIVTAIGSLAIIPLILWTMYTRDVFTGMYLTLGFGIITIILLRGDYRSPANIIVKAGYLLLALGIAFDPIDGGMTKDYCNLSYMLTTSGLACLLLYFLLWAEALLSKAGVSLNGGFTLTGQNPMLAYTLSSFILNPLYYIIGLGAIVDGACAGNPLMGFVRGLIISVAMLAFTSLFSKKKIYWRS